jgi:hypothetical protein
LSEKDQKKKNHNPHRLTKFHRRVYEKWRAAQDSTGVRVKDVAVTLVIAIHTLGFLRGSVVAVANS